MFLALSAGSETYHAKPAPAVFKFSDLRNNADSSFIFALMRE